MIFKPIHDNDYNLYFSSLFHNIKCTFVFVQKNCISSNGIVSASKRMNMQRQMTNLTRNKSLGLRLSHFPIKQSDQVRNVHTSVLTRRAILDTIDNFYSRSLCTRKINAYLRAQCSTCTTDVKGRLAIPKISKVRLRESYLDEKICRTCRRNIHLNVCK